jgi:hypothetical protein
LMPKRFAWW